MIAPAAALVPADRIELLCIGRAAVDLYGEQLGAGLDDVASFARYLGGSPANTAFGGARLGLRTAMLSRVGDEQNGEFVRRTLAGAGVDVSALRTDPQRLTALAFLALRDRERFPLLFYRAQCADMALAEDDVDDTLLARCGAVLISGTHLSQPGPLAACRRAMHLARSQGARVVLDIDYRPVLWGLTALGEGENRFVASAAVSALLQSVVGDCDLIVGTEEEIHIAGGSSDTVQALRQLRALSAATIVLKRGAAGCVVFEGAIPDAAEEGQVGAGFAVEVFNVLGAGDAFMAGFLRGWLRGEPIARCADWANACGALVVSRHGCAPAMPSWDELQWFLDRARADRLPRQLWRDAELAHVHRASTRTQAWPPLAVFAFDHRSQLEAIADTAGAHRDRIPRFKALALQALRATPAPPGLARGLLLDDRYGAELLPHAADEGLWLGRPVEQPGSLPLRWDFAGEIALQLRHWPAQHVAKCLVFFHAEQPEALRAQQLEKLLALQSACHASGHEWLLELIPPAGSTEPGTAQAMTLIYAAGLRPDWWKLPPAADRAAWQQQLDVIADNDRWCRGAVVLGLDAPLPLLRERFAAVPPGVRGFMVGRTIFGDAARAWFAGQIDDEAAVAAMRSRYADVMQAWIETRTSA